jgi:hypothetical protein
MPHDARIVLDRQDGVISRRQALAAGLEPHQIHRLLRRRLWVQVHRGVYVNHTGVPSWTQRAWIAVLSAWPAALYGESALRAVDRSFPTDSSETIHIAVDRRRSSFQPPVGVVVHHARHLAEVVLWNASPPRMRVEEAVIDAAAAADSDLDAIALLARWVQRRRTTATRLLEALGRRQRVRRRRWLEAVLQDVAAGTCSVLEHGFLARVERPHRLPRADRQRPAPGSQGLVYRDADYGLLLVELDGRLFHDSATARDADLERDLDAAADGRRSLRLGWGQVFGRPCTTAVKLAQVMRAVGIDARAEPCGPSCPVR